MSEDSAIAPIVKRSTVPHRANYQDYRPSLRRDFHYSCAYCTTTEVEALGLGFQIDHYLPQNKAQPGLTTDYQNLMWSCQPCNRLKGNYHPSSAQKEAGLEVFRVDREDPRTHVKPSGYRLDPITDKGRFNIEFLYLNRLALRNVREARKRLLDADGYIAYGIAEILKVGIDRIPRGARAKFVKVRSQLRDRVACLVEDTDSWIRQAAKSPLLDQDPDKRKDATSRRKYLKEVGAITSDFQGPTVPGTKSSRGKAKKKKKKANRRR